MFCGQRLRLGGSATRQFKAMVLGTFLISILVLSVSCASLCSKCTAQDIRIINNVTGKCVSCWFCSLLECPEGTGSSVACGTTVIEGTAIHCVACVRGANFSDSSGSGQCQPCGVCAGKHERVLLDCNIESDVKCECENGFYRNRTTKECQPCASCCAINGSIEERCRDDGGEIETKCNFKELWPSTCLSALTSTAEVLNASVSNSFVKQFSTVIVTSSFLMTSSSLHATSSTPLLESYPTIITPASSETVKIKATLSVASVSGQGRQTVSISKVSPKAKKPTQKDESHLSETMIILISTIAVVIAVGLFVCCRPAYCILKNMYRYLYRLWQSNSNQEALKVEAAMGNEGIRSSECSGPSEPLLDVEHPEQGLDPNGYHETAGKTTDPTNLSEAGLLINMSEWNSTDEKLEKGIPSSLDNGPKSQAGQQQRKRLASEGDDKSQPCLEGYQSQYTEACQDGTVNLAAGKMLVSYYQPSQLAAQSKPSPSSSDSAFSTSLVAVSASNADQTSGISVANQGAICNPSAELPIQSTEDNGGYFTHIKDVPDKLIHELCMLLDEERVLDGQDYKMFASELKLEPTRIRYLKELQKQSGKSPSYILLMQVFSSMKSLGTLKHLRSMFESMGRYDLVTVIDDWVFKNSQPIDS